MTKQSKQNERIANIAFASVYPLCVNRVEKKGRTEVELHQVLEWLTWYDEKRLQELNDENVTIESYFKTATLNPNAKFITGVTCGYRVERIENPPTQQARYMDKLVDELAKGKKMESILRKKSAFC